MKLISGLPIMIVKQGCQKSGIAGIKIGSLNLIGAVFKSNYWLFFKHSVAKGQYIDIHGDYFEYLKYFFNSLV